MNKKARVGGDERENVINPCANKRYCVKTYTDTYLLRHGAPVSIYSMHLNNPTPYAKDTSSGEGPSGNVPKMKRALPLWMATFIRSS